MPSWKMWKVKRTAVINGEKHVTEINIGGCTEQEAIEEARREMKDIDVTWVGDPLSGEELETFFKGRKE